MGVGDICFCSEMRLAGGFFGCFLLLLPFLTFLRENLSSSLDCVYTILSRTYQEIIESHRRSLRCLVGRSSALRMLV